MPAMGIEAPPAPEASLPAAASAALPSAGLGWHESWPAKLTAEAVAKLREDFESSYPTELLDQDSFSSRRFSLSFPHSDKQRGAVDTLEVQVEL